MYTFDTSEPGVHDMAKLQAFIYTITDEAEQENTMLLVYNLFQLNSYVNEYAATIALHNYIQTLRSQAHISIPKNTKDHTEKMYLFNVWDQMCGREAAMIVFHFGKSISAISSLLNKTPTIQKKINHDNIRSARKMLQQEFPNYELARHSAGHRAEAIASLETVKLHAFDHGHMKQHISGNIKGNSYVATFRGNELEIEMIETKRKALGEITNKIYSAFPDLYADLPTMI